MSYQGFGNLSGGPETVDEVADYTDMMGLASVANQGKARNGFAGLKSDATKSLIALWLFVLLTYWATGFFFRRFLV